MTRKKKTRNMGRTTAERFDAMTSKETAAGCRLWLGSVTSVGGYGKFTRYGNGGTVLAHRFAWESANGPIPSGMIVRHLKCNQPRCVNVSHLALGTHAENSADMTSQGRQCRGERLHTNKLTADQVLTIRGAWNSGVVTQRQLAAAFGVNGPNIHFIVNRKTWRHI